MTRVWTRFIIKLTFQKPQYQEFTLYKVDLENPLSLKWFTTLAEVISRCKSKNVYTLFLRSFLFVSIFLTIF